MAGARSWWSSLGLRSKGMRKTPGARDSGLQVEESAVRPVGAEVPVTRSGQRVG